VKVFITGASSGLGEALARYYAAQGATLGLFARREAELARLAAQCAGATVATYAGDVRDAEALSRAASAFLARFGAPDVVIANAGISVGIDATRADDLPVFRQVIDTNVTSLPQTFQPFLAAMLEARAGVLAGVASVAGYRGLPGSSAYSASKAAAISYLESLRVELRGTGVAVVTLCPGFLRTPLTSRNPYWMPFLTDVDVAAAKFARAIGKRQAFVVVPWQMAWVGCLLKLLPRWLYDEILGRAKRRKPRATR
jgi:short-subunit dehydrogenase